MNTALFLALKGLVGGVLVMLFALLSEALRPKRFAGLFAASPAVAIAGLTLVLADRGTADAHRAATGMIAGAGGLVLYTVVIVPMLKRRNVTLAAAVALGAWAAGAVVIALPLLLAT